MGARRGRAGAALAAALAVAVGLGAAGCVTVGDFRREMKDLEARVTAKNQSTTRDPAEIADLVSSMDELRTEMRGLKGRLEVAEKTASDALAEARRARQELAARSAGASATEGAAGAAVAGGAEGATPSESAELVAYRAAYADWRENHLDRCIDEFRSFLQTYPASDYADDAAFWLADCHFKQGDYKNAVLRFDDVVKNYPTGNKAPDALYRQGESLLRLGPGYHEAAKRAFERVVKEYPDSARAPEAAKQIKLLASG